MCTSTVTCSRGYTFYFELSKINDPGERRGREEDGRIAREKEREWQ